MSKKFMCVAGFVAVFFNGPVSAPSQHLSATGREALTHITAGSLYQHLSFLGSDSLEGRGTGTRGGELAAFYIARELQKYGIKPAGDEKLAQFSAARLGYFSRQLSATGIEALIKREIEICTASRPLQPGEVRRLAQQQQNLGIAFRVAKDGLSIYLHPDNPIRDLSLEQVKGIYTGRIKNWREVGGKNKAIVAFSRTPSSGTYLYFQEHVLEGQPYGDAIIAVPTTAAVAAEVTKNPRAIGYGGLAYGKNLVHCKIDGVSPTDEYVREDRYPIARYLYFYTIKKPDVVVKSFIDWVLGMEGQRVVKEIDYIPLFEVP